MNLSQTTIRVARRLLDRYDEWRDYSLDRKYGIDTRFARQSCAPPPGADNAHHGYYYEPIQIAVFDRIMNALPARPGSLTFVDFGSGKGRALILASLKGFRRAIGIEYDANLHAAAGRNVARYGSRSGRAAAIELHCADAAEYELPLEDCLCFFYNPFDEFTMAKVLERINDSLCACPRRLIVAYRNPRHGHLFAGAHFLRALVRNRSFELYEGM